MRTPTQSSPLASQSTDSDPSPLPLEVRRHPLVGHVGKQLVHRCGLKGSPDQPQPLIIGISGGADSIALLLACSVIASRRSGVTLIKPVAVHVHHHLRDSADDDATWVADLCLWFGVVCHIEHVHPGEMDGNVSANARTLRYEALTNVAKREQANYIAVAHHGDDQLETMIMALGRGAGLMGFSGMPWTRPLEGHEDIHLVRPLLDSRHHECEALCRAGGIVWREDPSNLDPSSARARVRHEITPVMDSLWPDAARRVTATGDLLAAAGIALEKMLGDIFGDPAQRTWVRNELKYLAPAIISAGLRRAALDCAPEVADEIGQKHLLQAAEAIADEEVRPRSFDWPGGIELCITSRQVEMKPGG